ncbi:hypothetical protein LO772_10500 [Yinghuangia sp. ASG 101]|uniref:hypothetical protein n=1 Tax=Yinghuangia sp. ASG 101 TaxID=2896848 RepID=UPI001E4F1A6C|nr:hypothetical protein [Yinghuangia sp. ASG 101]UGQ13987.1 hypothetical protein LO772_10500 [Yinghuangia sp. ASG 101]
MVYQLPPDIAHFVGRETEQQQVLEAVAGTVGAARPACVGLRSRAGSGKTELAYRLARTLRSRFPDHVLYTNLDDRRRGGAVEVFDVLGELLGSLGVPPDMLKSSFPERCKQFWSKTDGQRLITIVDNAWYGAEVRPLLPASGESMVIVISHGPLYDLDQAAPLELPLEPLPDAQAFELLRLVTADDPRLRAEPDALSGIMRICSGLPAALHTAAQWIRRYRRRPLSRLLREFAAEMDDKGISTVEAAWNVGYRMLSESAAHLYRLLEVFPGSTLTPASAAALLGRGADAADEALEELEEVGLLDGRGNRLRLPEALRSHARRRGREDGNEVERTDALVRIIRWYVRQAQTADLLAAGRRLLVGEPAAPVPGAPDVEFADEDAARRWLDEERQALGESIRLAYGLGRDGDAIALCEPLWTHFLDHGHHEDATEAFRTGVAAAQRCGSTAALVRMRCQTARALWEQGQFDEAEAEIEQALAARTVMEETELATKLEASAVESRGMLKSARGDWAGAAGDFTISRRLHTGIGNAYGELLMTYRLGEAASRLDELERAEALLAQAYAAAVAEGPRRERIAGRIGYALGGVFHRRGRFDESRALFDTVLTSARARGAQREQVRVLGALAELCASMGDEENARRHRDEAGQILRRNGVADESAEVG